MGHENSYVIGLMGRNSNSTSQLVFPTGSATVYGPFAVTPQNTTTQTYDGEYFSAGYGNYTLDPANTPQLDHVSLVEYWTIKSSVTPSANDDAKVKLFWRTHSRVSPTNTDWSNLRVVHFDNTDWNTEGTSPTINTTSTAWGSVESDIYCANFSPFTLGTITSNNPLPVELSSFTGTCNNDNTATLNWVTSSEINVKEFILQKSTDGFNFTPVAVVAATGNSTLPQSYTALDADFNTEFAYYRLLTVDLDGSSKLSTTILLNCSDNTSGVNIYAVEEQGIFVKTNMAVSSNSTVEVFDVAGKRIYNEQITLPQGYYKHHLDMETIIADGVYIVRLNTGSKIYSQKVWVH
ncbi:MAG TPA: T9SS type A sorting domain-containing protein [Chitinophagales bacterium]|nr:T9SS type A sorting domain-containing protein [Chitinophagales bacterium]